MSVDSIITMWDSGNQRRAFELLIKMSKEEQEQVNKLNKKLSESYLSGKGRK